MQYQVLARKWRPQSFHDLVGQEHVSRTLLNALLSGRVAHAFLFSGPRGSGKTTTARVLAKALNCHAGKPGEPCSQCPACTEIAAGNSMDVLEIDAASNRGIDEIRELREKVRYSPARDKNKIFIIDEVHMLTPEAFNALLKTLEEPPPRVIFILATTEYHKIPATILSRCQQYHFKLIPIPLILGRLSQIATAEKIQISTPALEQIAYSSGGSMRDAMSSLDQVIAFSGELVRDEDITMLLGLVEPAVLSESVQAIAGNDVDKILKLVADQAETGQDLHNFCRRLLGQFRNLMVLKAGVTDPSVLGVPESLMPDLRAQADLFSREDLLRLFDALLQTEADLKHATQTRFQLEMGLIELAQISRVRPLEELIAEFSALVQGSGPQSPAGRFESEGKGTASLTSTSGREPRVTRKLRLDDDLPGSSDSSSAKTPEPPRQVSDKISTGAAEPTLAQKISADGSNVPGELMQKIVSAVHKESLEGFLQSIPAAELRDDSVTLDLASLSEFSRRQIRDNLPVITQAASAVIGRPVTISLIEKQSMPLSEKASVALGQTSSPRSEVLERAKREPVVQSFLDVFPGPVKVEEIDS